MKRYLALLLAVLMCASAVALSACSSSTTANTNPTTTPTENSPTASAGTDDPTTASPTQGENKNEIFKPESEINNPVFNDLKKTPIIYDHQEAESLPSSFTLVGYDTLPAPLKSSNYKDVSCQRSGLYAVHQCRSSVSEKQGRYFAYSQHQLQLLLLSQIYQPVRKHLDGILRHFN